MQAMRYQELVRFAKDIPRLTANKLSYASWSIAVQATLLTLGLEITLRSYGCLDSSSPKVSTEARSQAYNENDAVVGFLFLTMTTEVALNVINSLKTENRSNRAGQGQVNSGMQDRVMGDFHAKEIWDLVKKNLGPTS